MRAAAALTRVFGDIDIAEDAVQDAFAGGPAVAGSRAAAEPGRMEHHDRAQPGHRGCAARRLGPESRPRPRCCRRGRTAGRKGPVPDDRLMAITCGHPALAGRPRSR